MATMNQLVKLGNILSPEDVRKLEREYPTLLNALKTWETVIDQVIERAGGSGGGSGVENLDDLTLLEASNRTDQRLMMLLAEKNASNLIVQNSSADQRIAFLSSRIDDLERLVRINGQ